MVLTYYTNLLSLSTRFIDDLQIVQSIVSFVVFISSLAYAIVSLNRKLKGVTYQHLAVDSVVCVIYAAIQCWTWIIRCGALCPYGYNYWSKLYDLYIFIYFKQTLDIFMMFVEIHLTYTKLQSFSNVRTKTYIPLYAKFIFFYIYALCICVPLNYLPRTLTLFGYLITSNNQNESVANANLTATDLLPLYKLVTLDKNDPFMKWNLITGFAGGVGPLIVYFILNSIVYFRLRSFLAQKRATLGPHRDMTIEKKEIKSSARIMVLGVNCLLGYFPNKLANNFLLYALTPDQWNLYIPFSNMLIWISNGLKLFINMAFDYEFRKVFFTTFHIPMKKSRVQGNSSIMTTFSTKIIEI